MFYNICMYGRKHEGVGVRKVNQTAIKMEMQVFENFPTHFGIYL